MVIQPAEMMESWRRVWVRMKAHAQAESEMMKMVIQLTVMMASWRRVWVRMNVQAESQTMKMVIQPVLEMENLLMMAMMEMES